MRIVPSAFIGLGLLVLVRLPAVGQGPFGLDTGMTLTATRQRMDFPSTTTAIIGIAGIVGTLVGAFGGAMINSRTTRLIHQRQLTNDNDTRTKQLAHENRTRFHEHRVRVYAEFTDACGKVTSTVSTAGPYPLQDMTRFLVSFEMLRLVASQRVVNASQPVHAAVGDAAAGRGFNKEKFATDMGLLIAAMRSEIGVSELD